MNSQTLSFTIDYPTEIAGWIECRLEYDGNSRSMYASNVFPPFINLLHFLLMIHRQRLPYRFYWDEEGEGVYFEALPVAEDDANFWLRVWHDRNNELWVDREFERKEIIELFLGAVREFVLYSYNPDQNYQSVMLQGHWGIRLSDLEPHESLLKEPYPLRHDERAVESLELRMKITPDQYREKLFEPSIEFWFWGQKVTSMHIEDRSHMWSCWAYFLENLLEGRFPAELEYIDTDWITTMKELLDEGTASLDEITRVPKVNLTALPSGSPNTFRLRILNTDYLTEEYLLLDEILDRKQFCGTWLDQFDSVIEASQEASSTDAEIPFPTRMLNRLRQILKSK